MVVGLSGPSGQFNLFGGIRHDDGAKLKWRAQWSRPAVSVVATTTREDNRLGDVSHRSRPRRMRSVKPNCLHDKSSVSSVASRLCSPLSSTHLRVRTLALSFVTRSSVIRYTWDEQTVSLSFSVWFVRISGCRHARLTIAASANREERSSSAGEIEALRHLLLRS